MGLDHLLKKSMSVHNKLFDDYKDKKNYIILLRDNFYSNYVGYFLLFRFFLRKSRSVVLTTMI